jgi:hypothetical protein
MVSLLSARGRCKTAAKIGARPALGQLPFGRKQSTLSAFRKPKRRVVRYWRAENGAGRVFMRTSVQSRAMAAMAGAGLGVALISFCILSGWLLLELY